jgi:Tol biopolymer transport system component
VDAGNRGNLMIMYACRTVVAAAIAVGVSAGSGPGLSVAASRPAVVLASVSTRGVQADEGTDEDVVLSADGKYVAFVSGATNLVPGDTNGRPDVFVRDLTRGLTRRATVDTAGAQSAGGVGLDVNGLSKDGRHVLFTSRAADLVVGDTNQGPDVFVRDMRYGITTRVSVGADGGELGRSFSRAGSAISDDGRYAVFTWSCGCTVLGTPNRTSELFVRDLKKGTTRRIFDVPTVNPGDSYSERPAISADGRYLVFTSYAAHLVPGDTNGTSDIFRHDLKTGTTIRVSVGPNGRQSTGGDPVQPSYAHNNADVSDDGRSVVFFSLAGNLVDGPHARGDVYLRDVKTGTTSVVTLGLGGVPHNASFGNPLFRPGISGNGRYVSFLSWATNLVQDDTNAVNDAFVRDLKKGVTRRAGTGTHGEEPNGYARSWRPALDRDGDTVAFVSEATNLIPDDVNGRQDAFVVHLRP